MAMQISEKYGLVYVITKLGLLFVYDLATATAVRSLSCSQLHSRVPSAALAGHMAVFQPGTLAAARLLTAGGSGKQVYRNRISQDPIFLTANSPITGGFYAINR